MIKPPMILVLLFALVGCAGQSRVDTLREALDATRVMVVGAYQTAQAICMSRESEVVSSSVPLATAELQIEAIRAECDQVLQPLLGVIRNSERLEQVFDIPWIEEAL